MQNFHYLKQGTILDKRYTIYSVLGEGGFGITYLGRDERLDMAVAIKEYYPQGVVTRNNTVSNTVEITYEKQSRAFFAGKKKFISEAKVMAKFDRTRGIVRVTDFFEANNTSYIVMEYLDGVTLKKYVAANGPLQEEEVLELMAPVVEALDAIHESGYIHRDISPDNIMLLKTGGVKLMDFGAAQDYTDFGEKSLSVVLKPGYTPPEQYRSHGVQGPWTDIYALCATIYKCLTGKTPDNAIDRLIEDNLKSPSRLGAFFSPSMERAVMKGMSLSPGDRYQTVKEFCDDFYSPMREIAWRENQQLPKKNKKGLAAILVILCLLLVGGGFALSRLGDKSSSPQPSAKTAGADVDSEETTDISSEATTEEKKEEIALSDPERSGERATWDCLWFGSYPQTEIVCEDDTEQLEALQKMNEDYETEYETVSRSEFEKIENASYDENGDGTVGGVKYRRMKKSDARCSRDNSENHYRWSDEETWHYFKFEPVKWRVLQVQDGEALLLCDRQINVKKYNKGGKSATWAESTLRSWLNAYSADYNTSDMEFSSYNFLKTAFTEDEQEAILEKKIENSDSEVYGTEGGEDTTDKCFLLSEKEISGTEAAKSYGFAEDGESIDEARQSRPTTYAFARGAYRSTEDGYEGNTWWWLRSPGPDTDKAVQIGQNGENTYGKTGSSDDGVRPALYLKLSDTNLYFYAGTVCSDGTVKEIESEQ